MTRIFGPWAGWVQMVGAGVAIALLVGGCHEVFEVWEQTP